MKYCINCRHTLSDDAEFCPKCGLKTEGVGLCEHCKQYVYFRGSTLIGTNIYNKNGVKYCRNCGASMSDLEIICPECNKFMPCTAECGNCSSSGYTEGPHFAHPVDSDYQGGTYNNSSHNYYDETPTRRQVSRGWQIAIKILLIVAILTTLFNAVENFVSASILSDNGIQSEVIDKLMSMPEYAELFQMLEIDQTQLIEMVRSYYYVMAVLSLIPLIWIFPMRKKILRAMRDGTTLSGGFKVCTLLFVNLILGIVLLVNKDI